MIPEHAEDQEDDQDELYVVVRGHARFEVAVRSESRDRPSGLSLPGSRAGLAACAHRHDTSARSRAV